MSDPQSLSTRSETRCFVPSTALTERFILCLRQSLKRNCCEAISAKWWKSQVAGSTATCARRRRSQRTPPRRAQAHTRRRDDRPDSSSLWALPVSQRMASVSTSLNGRMASAAPVGDGDTASRRVREQALRGVRSASARLALPFGDECIFESGIILPYLPYEVRPSTGCTVVRSGPRITHPCRVRC